MSDAIIGNTQVAATKMALITDMAQKELLAKAVFANYFTNVSQFAVKGMKSISFPKLSAFTVQERASGGTIDAQAITSTVDTLLLNVPAAVKWIIDPNDAIQSTLNWELELVSKAAASHGRYFDQKIRAAVLADAPEVSATGNITRDLVLEMRQYLKKNEADMSQVALFISPAQETQLLKIEEFSSLQVYGAPVNLSGSIGKVFGVDVVVCNCLEDGEYFMAEKGAIAYGFQRDPAYGEQDDLDHGVGAKKRGLDSLYGVKSLQIGMGNAAPTKSALMIKFKAD
jgi:hypothetical protein